MEAVSLIILAVGVLWVVDNMFHKPMKHEDYVDEGGWKHPVPMHERDYEH